MKKNVMSKLIAFILPLLFIACNSDEKTSSTDSSTDTTKTPSMDSSASKTMDAVTAAPNLYTVLKDTMGIRILKISYKPGDSSAMHSHPDNVLYVIDGAKMEFTMEDGSKRAADLTPGMTAITPGGAHSVKNVGKTTATAILVEVNRPNNASTLDTAMDAVKVAPKLYKVVKDTMNIRVLMATYPPGASSALHAHPDNAIYVIQGNNSEFTDKDGKKQTMEMGTGMINISPVQVHAVKNIGKGTTKVLIVEVNRPQK